MSLTGPDASDLMNPKAMPCASPDLQAPIAFTPIYQERLWGVQMIEEHFAQRLP